MKPSIFLLSGGLLLAMPATAQVVNTAVLANTTTLRSNGHHFTNAANGTYAVQSSTGVFEHNTSSYIFTNNGSYDASGSGGQTGTDHFTGTGTATIAGSVQPVFGNLTFANRIADTLVITNAAGARVAGTLNWSGGGLITTPRTAGGALSSALVFATTGSYSGSSSTQHVHGYVGKVFASGSNPFTFPVGDGTQLRTISLGVAVADYGKTYKVAYLPGSAATADPTTAPANLTALGTGLVSVSPVGAWDFSGPANAGSISVQLSMPDMNGPGGYAVPSNMRVVGYNTATSQWEALGTSGAMSNTAGSTIAGTIPAGEAPNYTAIGIGSSNAQPLALQLTNFTASLDASCRAQLAWETAAEQGLRVFGVEHGTDGRIYRMVGEVTADGRGRYAYTVEEVREGEAYFRLRGIEASGSEVFSNTVHITARCSGADVFTAGPNPVRDALVIRGLVGSTSVRVFTAAGQLVHQRAVVSPTTNIPASDWAAGVYLVELFSEGSPARVLRIVKQ